MCQQVTPFVSCRQFLLGYVWLRWKQGEWKIGKGKEGEKWYFLLFCWEGERKRKVVGPTNFLSSLFKIQSLQIGNKIRIKSEKNIWTKLPPTSLVRFCLFFFFFVDFSFVNCNVGLLFLFFFFFLSLVLSGGGFFFFSFFFFS